MTQTVKEKLLVTTSTFPRWSDDCTPPFVYELCRRLKKNFDVHVLAPHAEGAKQMEIIKGIKVHRFRYWIGSRDYFAGTAILPTLTKRKALWALVPLFLIAQFICLFTLIRREKIQIIHAHWILPQGILAVLCREILACKIRVFITSHGADLYGLNLFRALKRWTLNNSSGLSVVSRAMLKEVINLDIDKDFPVEVIPMGVDLSKFHPDARCEDLRRRLVEDGPLLLFVGRLSEKKGLKYLLEAMPQILEVHQNVKLMIIGGGEEAENLQAVAVSIGIQNHTVFLGPMPNHLLPPYYATADLFIGPSIMTKQGDREGLGLVFAEALGCCCPIVTTDLPSISDIVIDRETGIVVPAKASAAIAEAILYLLESKDDLAKLKGNCRQFVMDRFGWEIIAERYVRFLKSV